MPRDRRNYENDAAGLDSGGSSEVAEMKDPRHATLAALQLVQQNKASIDELWLFYWVNGGDADLIDFEAFLHGLLDPEEHARLIVAWALEELSAE